MTSSHENYLRFLYKSEQCTDCCSSQEELERPAGVQKTMLTEVIGSSTATGHWQNVHCKGCSADIPFSASKGWCFLWEASTVVSYIHRTGRSLYAENTGQWALSPSSWFFLLALIFEAVKARFFLCRSLRWLGQPSLQRSQGEATVTHFGAGFLSLISLSFYFFSLEYTALPNSCCSVKLAVSYSTQEL